MLPQNQKITERKLFGQYFHALIDHAPQQFRIMDLSAANAEDKERCFCFMKAVSTHTSNRHPENVLTNCFLRLQVHDDWDEKKYPKAWQCHFQRIPDFLQMKAWQEVAEGIMFHDHDDVIYFPRPHHFRSSSLKKEYVELKRIWNALDNSLIPSFVKIFDCGKQMKLKSLRFSEFVDLDGIFEESFGELVDESEDEGRDEPSDKEN
ncbi:uncharacterized protein [Clytia hemisphaerica]|uniref:uncharacterized protein n=1 Tax=Clytia hemisphaerica TaxID=252671 RepID=UPI0034D63467